MANKPLTRDELMRLAKKAAAEVGKLEAENERLRGMIEDKHGPILDADTFLMEQCRALREGLTQLLCACRRFIDSDEDGQERYDELCKVAREVEEAAEKREGRSDGDR